MNNTISRRDFVSISLAIFSMLFGAGNLIYPLAVGYASGSLLFYGLTGFLLTAVLLPVVGLVGMILFDGDYKAFFARLGDTAGSLLIFFSLMIIGPIIGIPRIITLSHTMIAPFIPLLFMQEITTYSSFVFSLVFLSCTFLATFRESKVVDILGKVVAPLLLGSLVIIIAKGIAAAQFATVSLNSHATLFKNGLVTGYETLDMLAIIFFASIIISILKQSTGNQHSVHTLAKIGFKAGLVGVSLLALVYVGMGFIGAYHGHGLFASDELFRLIAFHILGTQGAAIISLAVLMACFSTAIALGTVLAEYVQHEICKDRVSYVTALVLVLLSCIPLSTAGLKYVLQLTGGPITYVGYPMLITLTFCNIAYKIWGFRYVKIPVFLTFIIALLCYVV